jgi:hypothetical protein
MFLVPPAPAPYLANARLHEIKISFRSKPYTGGYALHGFKYDGIISHPQVVVCAPDLDLLVHICGMRYRKLVSESIDVIEVAVGLILVLPLQLGRIEIVVAEDI